MAEQFAPILSHRQEAGRMSWRRILAAMLAASAMAATGANAASLDVQASDVFTTMLPFSPYLISDTFEFGAGSRLGDTPGSPWTVHVGEFRGMPGDTLRSQWTTSWAHATVDTGLVWNITVSTELVDIPHQAGKSGAGLSFLSTSDGTGYAYAVYRRAAGTIEIGVRTADQTSILSTVDAGNHDRIILSVSVGEDGFVVAAAGASTAISFSDSPEQFALLLQGDPSGTGNSRQGIVADSDNSTRFTSFTVASP